MASAFENIKRTHYCGELRSDDIDSKVTLMGWVHGRRDLGGFIFIDLRDRKGIVQITFDPDICQEALNDARQLRSEFVIARLPLARCCGGPIVTCCQMGKGRDALRGMVRSVPRRKTGSKGISGRSATSLPTPLWKDPTRPGSPRVPSGKMMMFSCASRMAPIRSTASPPPDSRSTQMGLKR